MPVTCTMILGDCLEVMPTLPEASVRLTFADLPYGLICQKWDCQIDLVRFWPPVLSISAPGSVSLFTATQPFATSLINSQPKLFRYDLVWNKGRSSNFFQAKIRPMRTHEVILLFSRNSGTYNPQMTVGPNCAGRLTKTQGSKSAHYGSEHKIGAMRGRSDNLRFPVSIVDAPHNRKYQHPTQKPLALLDWLIRTYSNEGDMVLDPTSGSGTTAVSAIQNGRSVTCIEKDPDYFEASVERVRKHVKDQLIDAVVEVRR